jgi:formylglycine-generating enzyme required for sulfatase activity
MCQTLPLERSTTVVAELRRAGFRPVNYRPYVTAGKPQLAALWTRDGKDFRLAERVTAGELRREDEKQRSEGFLPLDVASYGTGEGLRHTGLWARPDAGATDSRLYVGVADAWHAVSWGPLQKAGYVPRTQVQVDGPGGPWHSAVWWKPAKPRAGVNGGFRLSESEYEDNLTPQTVQTDVRVERSTGARSHGRLETLRRQLGQAENALAKNPQDVNGRWQAAWTLVALARPAEALPHFDALLAKYPKVEVAYGQRALARARTGDNAGARADLATFVDLSSRPDERMVLDVQVSAVLGGEAAALKRLEAAVAANPDSANYLYAAARACSLAAEAKAARESAAAGAATGPAVRGATLPGGAGRADDLALRAVELLRRAAAAGFRDFARMADDADLAFVEHQPGFRELVGRGRPERRYAAVWDADADTESVESHGLDPSSHQERCRRLAAEGWRPVSVSLAETVPGGPLVTASAWQRPRVSEIAREARARRQAGAAVALLRLNEPGPAWPKLRHTPWPDARSYLVRELASCGVEAVTLARRLDDEEDVSARRALILALGEYPAEQVPAAVKDDVVRKLLAWYRSDPDAGVHGAIDWLLRQGREGPVPRKMDWGQEAALAAIDRESAGTPPAAGQGWLVTKSGLTMTAVPGPVDFWMGSPPGEPGRSEDETRHRRRIVRGFAVATKPVTVALYKEFLRSSPPDVPTNYAEGYSPDEECPVNGVDWFSAAKFCRWLSEREGVPESEMCYPPMRDIKEGMRGFTGDPGRTGYRLPSEAEWEYVCRAGAESSRFFGGGEDLLPRYAWFLRNSNNRTWPVGQKRPNDLGMFDTHGGVWNWCQGHYGPYGGGGYREDEELADYKSVKDAESRMLRGGTYDSQPQSVRCAYRNANRPTLRILNVGFRVARTLPRNP